MKQYLLYGLLGVAVVTGGFVSGVAYEKTRILSQIDTAQRSDQTRQMKDYMGSHDSIRFFESRETNISPLRLENLVKSNKWPRKR